MVLTISPKQVKHGHLTGNVSYDSSMDDSDPMFCCEGLVYDVVVEYQVPPTFLNASAILLTMSFIIAIVVLR